MAINLKNFKNNLKALLFGLVFSLILLELGCLLLVESGHIPCGVPSYSLASKGPRFWSFLNKDFGPWHYKNTSSRQLGACFDVLHHTNSYGARDIERPIKSNKLRTVVLGDSFVEGYAVCDTCRVTNFLEKSLGIPFLNFGVTGGFGPTQCYVLYEKLAKQFDHDVVMMGILPDNDFQDDLPNPGRYHPYWKGRYPNYMLAYTGEKYLVDETQKEQEDRDMRWYLRNFSYTMNVADWLEAYVKWRRNMSRQVKQMPRGESRFEQFSTEEFDRMRFSIEKICEAAGEREVIVFLIPRFTDILSYEKNGHNPLAEELQSTIDMPNFRLVDLVSGMHATHKEEWVDYYLPCDRHWSRRGHEVAAELLGSELEPLLKSNGSL
ncbi:MAG: hypothetical protein AAF694_01155 [Bacteroidota bacterium]